MKEDEQNINIQLAVSQKGSPSKSVILLVNIQRGETLKIFLFCTHSTKQTYSFHRHSCVFHWNDDPCDKKETKTISSRLEIHSYFDETTFFTSPWLLTTYFASGWLHCQLFLSLPDSKLSQWTYYYCLGNNVWLTLIPAINDLVIAVQFVPWTLELWWLESD